MAMREDMGKVLVERPRKRCGFLQGKCGKGYATRVRREMATEDGSPIREGTMRRYGGRGDKYFNEHLGPLRRFIDSNVGRPWDKVFSEISKHVDSGNVVQKHILTHLFEYVIVNVELIDGEPYRDARNRWAFYNRPLRGPNCWYVCPKSGLLKRAKPQSRRNRRKMPAPLTPIEWVSATQFVRWEPAGWVLVTVKPWPPEWNNHFRMPPPPKVYDVLLRVKATHDENEHLRSYYGKRVYAVAVRRITQRELERLPITLPGKLTAPNVVR
jgi:hypothetical protein